MKNIFLNSIVVLGLLMAPLQAQSPEKSSERKPQPASSQDMVTINFPNGSLDVIIQLYSQLTGRTAIYPSNIQARIVLQSNGPLTREDAIRALENALSVNGFAIIPQGEKFFKVVPNQTAKQEGVPFHSGATDSSDKLVTQIFTLRFTDAQTAMQSIQPLVHPFGQLMPFPRTNSLLITDTSANIQQFKRMIEQLDQPIEARVQAKFYQLKNAKAKDVLAQLQSLLQSSQASAGSTPVGGIGGRPPGAVQPSVSPTVMGGELTMSEDAIVVGKVSMSADERTNQIVVLTRTINLPFFDQIISKLDIDTAATVVIKSIPLKYAKADETASLLSQMTGGNTGTSSGVKSSRLADRNPDMGAPGYKDRSAPPTPSQPTFQGGKGANSESGLSNKASVFGDIRTNSILLVGSADEVKALEEIVNQIDVLLAQVVIEGLIMEVSLENERDVGVSAIRRGLDQAGVANGLTIRPINLATTAIPAITTGGLTYLASWQDGIKLDLVIQALAKDTDVSILSHPVLQTSHNEEARIFVGETRPYITGTVSDIVGTTSTAVRSQYESKEIGLELTIKPLINPDGLVVMDIIQKIETVSGFQTIDGNEIPIIAKRQASSVVSINSGSMVILGGLTQNQRTYIRQGIPILRDIPYLGYLFQGTNLNKKRTELMVLLQPMVLKTPEEAAKEAVDLRDKAQRLLKMKEKTEEENKADPNKSIVPNFLRNNPY